MASSRRCLHAVRFAQMRSACGGGGADRGGAADAGVIAADHREDLDAADVAALEHALGRADIGKHAALAGRDDHQLEIFGALLVDAARQRRREVHLAHRPA